MDRLRVRDKSYMRVEVWDPLEGRQISVTEVPLFRVLGVSPLPLSSVMDATRPCTSTDGERRSINKVLAFGVARRSGFRVVRVDTACRQAIREVGDFPSRVVGSEYD